MTRRPTRHRWRPSYLKRQGHTTPAQRRALRELWPRFGLTFEHGAALPLSTAWPTPGALTLEIGFGRGEHLLSAALREPGRNLLGIETHRPAVGAVLIELERRGIENVRLLRGDALRVLVDHIEGRPFDRVCIFFPDPWHREKDHDRRIVRPFVIAQIAAHMADGGTLHLATDVEPYAHAMLETVEASEGWTNAHGGGAFAPRPEWRPETRYEKKGRAEGRDPFDLEFVYSIE